MIEAHQLSRWYGATQAVARVSFEVDRGEVVGLLGPNGAGKSSLLRMVVGTLRPSAGRVQVAGLDPATSSGRKELGYLPQGAAFEARSRVGEVLLCRARLAGLRGAAAREAINRAAERCGLEDRVQQTVGTLSGGLVQRLGLAVATVHRPSCLVLDEPTAGLDPRQVVGLRDLVRDLARQSVRASGDRGGRGGGKRSKSGRPAVLLSTHVLAEAERLCDRVVVLDQGRVVDAGAPAELRRRWMGATVLELTVETLGEQVVSQLESISGVFRARIHEPAAQSTGASSGAVLVVECRLDEDPRKEIAQLAAERRWGLLELTSREATLEELFVRLTTEENTAGETS
ncbi:MAG: ABC transporter ATP-binding protein [Acidobacteriota bacterium]